MMCYKDITFCPFLKCTTQTCDRRLTDEVKADARKWWGKEGAPIATYTTVPECFRSLPLKIN